jgi:hypothetical protein
MVKVEHVADLITEDSGYGWWGQARVSLPSKKNLHKRWGGVPDGKLVSFPKPAL